MRLTLELLPEESSFVEEAVRSGRFPDPKTMIVAALHAMQDREDEILGYTMEELRRLGDEGEASGPGVEIDFEEIKREAFRQAGIAVPKT